MYRVNTAELKKAMIDNDINSIGELSEKCGVNRVTLGTIISGKSYPSSDSMVRIASALKMSGEKAGSIFFDDNLT